MKSSTINLVLASAALLVASAAASAQTMKAEIPFPFEVAGTSMPAGTYILSSLNGELQFVLRNDSHDSIFVKSQAGTDPQKEWRSSKAGVLEFVCGDGCALTEIWTNLGHPAHNVGTSKAEAGRVHRVAVIRLATDKAK